MSRPTQNIMGFFGKRKLFDKEAGAPGSDYTPVGEAVIVPADLKTVIFDAAIAYIEDGAVSGQQALIEVYMYVSDAIYQPYRDKTLYGSTGVNGKRLPEPLAELTKRSRPG